MNSQLTDILKQYTSGTIAVSGGVDSITLAYAAHREFPNVFTMVHAVSPAVPDMATRRVKDFASQYNWSLRVVDAHEFQDPRYLANPVNRCFYCKTNLYAALSKIGIENLMSGTNMDDLSDFRPGLKAAEDFDVVHPFVEAGMSKTDVRMLADEFGLSEIAALPASPCLASRVETGIKIDSKELLFIDKVEQLVQNSLSPRTVRCRLRREKIVISLDQQALEQLTPLQSEDIIGRVKNLGGNLIQRPISFGTYKMGEAFLRSDST